jgi:hypothetical protein
MMDLAEEVQIAGVLAGAGWVMPTTKLAFGVVSR